ncbi:MAG: RES family NAD+ phosphorylase [Cyclobacteriaceae bacterium]
MLLYRLARKAYANQLDGKGAALYGGRWNSVGRPVVYTSEHRSLAVLEYRVNNPLPVKDLMMITLEVPANSFIDLERTALPANWKEYSPDSPTARLGDEWLLKGASLLFKVPSVPVPEEFNYLINPLHSQMSEVKILDINPYLLDSRIY